MPYQGCRARRSRRVRQDAVAAEHQDEVDVVGAAADWLTRARAFRAWATALAVGALGLGNGTGLKRSLPPLQHYREILRRPTPFPVAARTVESGCVGRQIRPRRQHWCLKGSACLTAVLVLSSRTAPPRRRRRRPRCWSAAVIPLRSQNWRGSVHACGSTNVTEKIPAEGKAVMASTPHTQHNARWPPS